MLLEMEVVDLHMKGAMNSVKGKSGTHVWRRIRRQPNRTPLPNSISRFRRSKSNVVTGAVEACSAAPLAAVMPSVGG